MTSWEITTLPPNHLFTLWRLMVDGVELERLTWDPLRSQYVDARQIACGGNWNEAKSFCETRAKKSASARPDTLPRPAFRDGAKPL